MSVRPVGNLPASVYWRRRLLVLVPLLFLVGLTVYVACSPGGDGKAGASAPVASTSSVAPSTSAGPTGTPSPSASASSSAAANSPAATACVPTSLQLTAVTSAPSYTVGSEPQLSLQVTNTAMAPCTQDLADAQVELTVFNGDARVWGSHDCKIEPGTAVSTLAPNQPVKLSITWTGLSSQPGCTAQRVRVAAGTYTLHASLAEMEGATAQFTLT